MFFKAQSFAQTNKISECHTIKKKAEKGRLLLKIGNTNY